MHSRSTLLWLLLISFVLTPLSTLHVHAAADHHDSALHGGHLHGFDAGDVDDHGTDAEPIVDVQLVASDRSGDFRWTEWLPLFFELGVAWLSSPYLATILHPPPIDDLPISHRSYWKPPLRGPPLISIPAQ